MRIGVIISSNIFRDSFIPLTLTILELQFTNHVVYNSCLEIVK